MHALVIDDARPIRSFERRMLAKLGFEVTEADDGRVGLARTVDSGPFDVVLVDWNMPEMNGIEFIKSVRSADSHHSDVKVLMVTSLTDTDSMVEALEAGANDYLMKPFTEEELVEKLELIGVEVSR